MPWKDDKTVVEGIELLTDRCLNLLVASAFKIGTPDAAVKEGITAEYTIGTADKADPTGCMSVSVEDIFGDEFQFLNMFNDAVRFVAGVDNDRFERLGTGIQVTILLKCSDRHTRDNRCLLLLRFGHALFHPSLT